MILVAECSYSSSQPTSGRECNRLDNLLSSRPSEKFMDKKKACCIWRSKHNEAFKLWFTECNSVFAKLQEFCPACGLRVMLVGFDAWWERRKGYHP